MVIAFLIYYVVVIYLITPHFADQRKVLIGTCFFLVVWIGMRSYGYRDTIVYVQAFNDAPPIWGIFSYNWNQFKVGYVEKGFYILASFFKSFSSEPRFYLFSIGAISMYLLFKSLDKYCIVPLVGICDYISRFLLNRDFIQIRSSLAILMIVLSIDLIQQRKTLKFFLVVLLAYQLHHMALIAVPFYFLNMLKIKKSTIYIGLILAFIFSQTGASSISGWVDNYSEDLNYSTYTQGQYVDQALGLKNPMIYLQLLILLLFTNKEKVLKNMTPYYYIFRNGYFYSTLILVLFCNYTALSGRTSTMFATYECFILPLLAKVFDKKMQFYYYFGLGIVLLYFFYSKYAQCQIDISNFGG